jgi:hypothetical protein
MGWLYFSGRAGFDAQDEDTGTHQGLEEDQAESGRSRMREEVD